MTVPVVSEDLPLSTAGSSALRWVEVVDGAPAVLEVPTDHARRRDLGADVATENFALTAEIAARVRATADRKGASPAGVLFCAWAAIVSRASDQRDIVFGDVSNGATAIRLRSTFESTGFAR